MWAKGPGYLGSLVKMKALKSNYMDVNPSPKVCKLGSPWTNWFSLSLLSFSSAKWV